MCRSRTQAAAARVSSRCKWRHPCGRRRSQLLAIPRRLAQPSAVLAEAGAPLGAESVRRQCWTRSMARQPTGSAGRAGHRPDLTRAPGRAREQLVCRRRWNRRTFSSICSSSSSSSSSNSSITRGSCRGHNRTSNSISSCSRAPRVCRQRVRRRFNRGLSANPTAAGRSAANPGACCCQSLAQGARRILLRKRCPGRCLGHRRMRGDAGSTI
mmetsp:Transcript_27086/g.78575  ORF Transcript_27086/g.78575 Transcript_27086/m.78575 type:complete len:212 (+) Transcript_27086:380-1015(+)